MRKENLEYTKTTNVKDLDLKCTCGNEVDIQGVSNWHDGTGLYYCHCSYCGNQTNVRWKSKKA